MQSSSLREGLVIPDTWDIYNFEIGDEFQYRADYYAPFVFGGYDGYMKQRILNKTINQAGYEYVVERLFAGATNVFYHVQNKDTVTVQYYQQSKIDNFNFEFYLQIDGSSQTLIIEDNGNLTKRIAYGTMYFDPNTFCPYNSGNYTDYKAGLGAVYSISVAEPESKIIQQIGYIKSGDTVGTVYSDSMMYQFLYTSNINHSDNIATIFPNPSSDGQFDIKLLEQSPEKIEVSIFNISGQLLYDETFNSSSDIINVRVVQPLAAGFYIVKIRSGKKEQYLKWQRF
jgi:hypothetical protein